MCPDHGTQHIGYHTQGKITCNVKGCDWTNRPSQEGAVKVGDVVLVRMKVVNVRKDDPQFKQCMLTVTAGNNLYTSCTPDDVAEVVYRASV